MARKKKQPATKVVAISLTTEDKAAMGVQLANVIAQVEALRTQKAEEGARFQKLIDQQLDIATALGQQLRAGTQDRDQASLKVGEGGELEVPTAPFAEGGVGGVESVSVEHAGESVTITAADADRIRANVDAAMVPHAVAEAIAKNGGEVDLSAGKAANTESLVDLADAATRKRGRRKPPVAPRSAPVTITAAPTSCPDCGGKVHLIDASGVWGCDDEHLAGCSWTAVVESQAATEALGGIGA